MNQCQTQAQPSTRPGGRLAIPPEQAAELFRQAVDAFDRADLLKACEPIKTLRLAGISVKITLPLKPRASTSGRLFEGADS